MFCWNGNSVRTRVTSTNHCPSTVRDRWIRIRWFSKTYRSASNQITVLAPIWAMNENSHWTWQNWLVKFYRATLPKSANLRMSLLKWVRVTDVRAFIRHGYHFFFFFSKFDIFPLFAGTRNGEKTWRWEASTCRIERSIQSYDCRESKNVAFVANGTQSRRTSPLSRIEATM